MEQKRAGRSEGYMRRSVVYLSCLSFLFLLLVSIFIHARYQQAHAALRLNEMARIAKELEVTDLCLFTEARYTRHPSQADLQTPFQDHPMAMEHFPSGSLVKIPGNIGRNTCYDTLDQ
jgi:hypothetical protein